MIGNIFYLPIMKTLTGVDAVNVVVVVNDFKSHQRRTAAAFFVLLIQH